MAATAQDSTAPLRSGEGKKDEDREEESASALRFAWRAVPAAAACARWQPDEGGWRLGRLIEAWRAVGMRDCSRTGQRRGAPAANQLLRDLRLWCCLLLPFVVGNARPLPAAPATTCS